MGRAPVDLVILALGCNDLKKRVSLSAFDIVEGARRLVFLALAYGEGPEAAPAENPARRAPPVARPSAYAEMFEGAMETSRLLGERYRAVAEEEGAAFLDAGQVIRCADLDGIHYDADQHDLLGRAAARASRCWTPRASERDLLRPPATKRQVRPQLPLSIQP
jgi:lysophospholipase L1-like esterase